MSSLFYSEKECEGVEIKRSASDGTFRHLTSPQIILFAACFVHAEKRLTVSSPENFIPRIGEQGVEPAAVIGQQGHGVPTFCSTVSPLLSRNASCLGSRPRKFLSISEAS